MHIDEILMRQRRFFASGQTLSVAFRREMLKRLYRAVQKYERDIAVALKADLGKSDYEAFMCETGMALSEIGYMIRHLGRFAARRIVPTPLAQFPSISYTKPTPYGNVLIMSPWNYPLLLTIDPLANAIAAGNTVVLKPSAYAPATGDVVEKIIERCYPPEYVAAVRGGRKENAELLEKKFDMVFFTGSQAVGKEVLRHTAEHLTPAVLELGGKSPCIVDSTAKVELAARRIVFGKYLNCGQTCVAPDFVLCDKKIKDELLTAICQQIQAQYGLSALDRPDYGKIVNKKHFDRLWGLMSSGKVVYGGRGDRGRLQIEPTVMDGVAWNDPVMQEEIFGPILPVLTYEKWRDVISLLREKPKPLALYLFTENENHIRQVTSRISYGGGCINDVVIHLATSAMGFGGVGESGMGSYHGKAGFDAFSHSKSILEKKAWLDLPMRYQPYHRKLYGGLLRLFLR